MFRIVLCTRNGEEYRGMEEFSSRGKAEKELDEQLEGDAGYFDGSPVIGGYVEEC